MKIGFIKFKDFLFVPDKYCIVKDNHGGLFLVNGIDEKKVERLL